jgi:deoxyribose-phosphate aldolase
MELKDILSKVDHTLLKVNATWEEIKSICDEGIYYETASVCIPASYVKDAAKYSEGRIPICTVIGFPNGYSTTASKCFEASDAINNGACEIDMVINIGWLKDKNYQSVLNEINEVKKVCQEKILKVIIETSLLNQQEKIKMCEIISDSNADFIKTSTGFSTGGATKEDVALFSKHIRPNIKIKAAGGISSLADAEEFIHLGASRLGTSRIIKIVKGMKTA